CHCEYINPRSASFCSVGILILPPNGDQAAKPVSSYRMIRMFGAPLGACGKVNGPQSGLESRTSSLMTPLKGFFDMRLVRDVGTTILQILERKCGRCCRYFYTCKQTRAN